jgi:hypothetical protein
VKLRSNPAEPGGDYPLGEGKPKRKSHTQRTQEGEKFSVVPHHLIVIEMQLKRIETDKHGQPTQCEQGNSSDQAKFLVSH